MHKAIAKIAWPLALVFLYFGSAQAAETNSSLTAEQLAHCASQVQTLRPESARLNDVAQQNESRRAALAQQHGGANQSADLVIKYNQAAAAFNNHMQQFRQDVAEINAIRTAYDQRCANRSFRRADLEALPPSLADAMRAGLADVQVPVTNASNADLQ